MTLLPSGQVAGISSERARYHATRCGIRAGRDTPHRDLYPLVDIIFADRMGPAGLGDKGYHFTGHTLADGQWLMKWKPEDRQRFLTWLTEPGPVHEIEGARKRLLHDTLPHRVRSYDYPLRLYSTLRRRLAEHTTRSATVGQWRNTIRNLRDTGVREEEVAWSGLHEFLDLAEAAGKARLDREDLLSRIDFSDIRLELTNELTGDPEACPRFDDCAVILDGAGRLLAGLDLAPGEVPVVRFADPLLHYRVGYVKRPRSASAGPDRWFALDPYGRALPDPDPATGPYYGSAADAVGAVGRHAAGHYGLTTGLRANTKFEYMSLHGGDDYREWLVILPDYQPTQFTPHFTERNVLVHFRTKARRDRRGRRLLFIEEVQSDWHQRAARRDGPAQVRVPPAPFRKEWSLLALKLLLLHAVDEGYDGLAWSPAAVQTMRYGCPTEPVLRLYDHTLGEQLRRLSAPWDGHLGTGTIETKEPWIHPRRVGDFWSVADRSGRFVTRNRLSKAEAVALRDRHSKAIELSVPVFPIPGPMRAAIARDGLPLFGFTPA